MQVARKSEACPHHCNWTQALSFLHSIPHAQGWAYAHLLSLFHGHRALVLGCVEKADVRILAHCGGSGKQGGVSHGCSSQALLALPSWGSSAPGNGQSPLGAFAGDHPPIFHLNGSPNILIPFHNQKSFPQGQLCPEPRQPQRRWHQQ